MAEFTDYLSLELLDHAFGETARAFTPTTTLQLVLLTATASSTDDARTNLTEPSTGGYAPQAITFAAASGTSPNCLVDNTAAITFTNSAATAWTVVGIAIIDSTATGANVYCFDNDMTDATIGIGEKLQFALGDIDIKLD